MTPSLTLIPDLGDLLRAQPAYNAATVVELARGLGAGPLLWLSGPDPDHPARDALGAARMEVLDLAPDWSWAEAEHAALTSFLGQFPQGRERLGAADEAERRLAGAIAGPLTLERLTGPELLLAARSYHADLAAALDEGPGTRWQERRLDELAARLAGRGGVALAALDDLPGLLERLPQARLPDAAGFRPGESSRLRALADRAEGLAEADDPNALLEALERESGDPLTPKAELQYAAGNISLALGELAGARAALEAAAHSLSDQPRSLPGLVLARLGQVRDAQGDRELALRTYRAVLALHFAPMVAREAAQRGLEQPFILDLTQN